jgi:hypothetical protein
LLHLLQLFLSLLLLLSFSQLLTTSKNRGFGNWLGCGLLLEVLVVLDGQSGFLVIEVLF